MVELQVEQRIRYPPFEPHRFIPAELPIVSSIDTVETGDRDELLRSLQSLAPSFKLGGEASWLVEQRYLIDGVPFRDEEIEREQHVLERNKKPLLVNKQRQDGTLHQIQYTQRYETSFPKRLSFYSLLSDIYSSNRSYVRLECLELAQVLFE